MARPEENIIYQRGKFWLAPDVLSDGSLRTPYLTVFWYERPPTRRIRSRSSRTTDAAEAIAFLDRMYLEDAGQGLAFCPGCGRPMAHARSYLIADAIADYRLEVGDKRVSADSIAARLNNVLDYLEASDRIAATCDQAAALAEPMREWLAAQPVKSRSKNGTVTKTRPRTAATVEEVLHQFRAALNHAHKRQRIEAPPQFVSRTRREVSPLRLARADVEQIAAMLRWAADPKWKRRGPLHAFLIGSICTLARPNAIVDISTDSGRAQWQGNLLDLNPRGRVQTKKHRPIVPVPATLDRWLGEIQADPKSKGWLCQVAGEPVRSVKTAWDAMRNEVGFPKGPEWGTYILRHSLANLVRARGATQWDLQGQMGHRVAGTTEIYAAGTLYITAQTALASVLHDLESIAPEALHRRRTG
jgi:integrase